ncbi:hypothetical protein DUI87_09305 [Hirundo rustica rustica]|uniref:Uncharacterized protein n=1 Tax=Hirundo rustica rustica TaxID=333673 RepID=A0A3M0KS79_HIRRU|nr:hypothetical protein DUI87_09305 [Hirundo rustica rustica]
MVGTLPSRKGYAGQQLLNISQGVAKTASGILACVSNSVARAPVPSTVQLLHLSEDVAEINEIHAKATKTINDKIIVESCFEEAEI